jgi:hypothetical protein
MKKILSKLSKIERTTVIKNSFLLPILSVVVMSISHVISWYDLGNPFSWAIYLSVAVEVFALASVSAASIKIKKGSIWLLFGLVTFIQIVGNVFFTFQDIDINGSQFKSWVELVQPWFEDWSALDHRRLLALIQGGTLPFMSLIALHFYIKFNENLGGNTNTTLVDPLPEPVPDNSPEDDKIDDGPEPEVESPVIEIEETTEEKIEPEAIVEVHTEEVAEVPVSEVETADFFVAETEPEVQSNVEDEKKVDSDQINSIDSSRRRKRLHPARY